MVEDGGACNAVARRWASITGQRGLEAMELPLVKGR